ncbi:MAG: type II toxin-antitoxin system YafQ family toxin [Treponemataceae bacterium]|nr:type II toxin-antitoxin system YafQ family toxin [Treponemataceae bacterium]
MVSEYKYLVRWTAQYKKDVKLAKRRQYDMAELEAVIKKLANAEPLEERYRELHIKLDWLLIYQIKDDVLILELSRTGTHSDLFKK